MIFERTTQTQSSQKKELGGLIKNLGVLYGNCYSSKYLNRSSMTKFAAIGPNPNQ